MAKKIKRPGFDGMLYNMDQLLQSYSTIEGTDRQQQAITDMRKAITDLYRAMANYERAQ